jgi:hypothetical protein
MIPYLAIAILVLVVAAIGLHFRRNRHSGTALPQERNDVRRPDHDVLTDLLSDLEADAIAEGEDLTFFDSRKWISTPANTVAQPQPESAND